VNRKDEVVDPGLSKLISEYLRDRRQRANLTQRQLADLSQGRAGHFDHSWVSQWEQRGPKSGLVKSLTYLATLGADFELMSEMIQLPIETPNLKRQSSLEAQIASCRRLCNEGRFGAALGASLSAARGADSLGDPGKAAAAWLIFSIAAKLLEGYRCAEYAVGQLLSFYEDDERDPDLMARALIQAAALATWRGNTAQAEVLLSRIELAAPRDAICAALAIHGRAFVAATKGDVPAAADLYREALAKYSSPEPAVHCSLLACIGLAEARLGRASSGLEMIERAAGPAERASLLVRLVLDLTAGRVLMYSGDYSRSLRSLADAEAKAKQLQLWNRLFETNLVIHEVATRSKDAPLAALTRRKLRHQRQRAKLTPALIKTYEQRFAASRSARS
jgi:transcriptional regulator with XRE-family HTH domain